MPGWLKALLIVVVVIIVLVVGVVIAGVYWISRNKDAWIAKGKEVMTEGRDAGRKTDNQGCVDESISRYKKDPALPARFRTASSCADVWRAAVPREASAMTFPGRPSLSRARSGVCRNAPASTLKKITTASTSSLRCNSSAKNERGRETRLPLPLGVGWGEGLAKRDQE